MVKGTAAPGLLDSYEPERIAFARRLVATTDRVFSFVTADGPIANLVRTRIAPLLLPKVTSVERVREFMFRTVSQITLNYRATALSSGSAGHVQGGDRLPWVAGGGVDNFDSLAQMTWQVHVYGEANQALAQWCTDRAVPLQVYPWTPAHETAGLARDACYLLRPDTYVALADSRASADALERYFSAHKIQPGS
ncbi:hypothetical protein D3C76_1325850 [compost metagenome]